jgi:hypothetical protein
MIRGCGSRHGGWSVAKSTRAEKLASQLAASVIARLGITKAAGAGVCLDDMAAQFRPLAEEYVSTCKQVKRLRQQVRQMSRHVEQKKPTAVGHGFVPFDPAEWQSELMRRVPPRRVNGFHFNTRSTDGTEAPPGHPG